MLKKIFTIALLIITLAGIGRLAFADLPQVQIPEGVRPATETLERVRDLQQAIELSKTNPFSSCEIATISYVEQSAIYTVKIECALSYKPNVNNLKLMNIADGGSMISVQQVSFNVGDVSMGLGFPISVSSIAEKDVLNYKLVSTVVMADNTTYVHESKMLSLCKIAGELRVCPILGEPPVQEPSEEPASEEAAAETAADAQVGDLNLQQTDIIGIGVEGSVDQITPSQAEGGGHCSLNPDAMHGPFGMMIILLLISVTPFALARVKKKK